MPDEVGRRGPFPVLRGRIRRSYPETRSFVVEVVENRPPAPRGVKHEEVGLMMSRFGGEDDRIRCQERGDEIQTLSSLKRNMIHARAVIQWMRRPRNVVEKSAALNVEVKLVDNRNSG